MKRNILWNRPEPTSKEIETKQDFSSVLNSVSKTPPFYQTKWFLGSSILVVGITSSLFLIDGNDSQSNKTELAVHSTDSSDKEIELEKNIIQEPSVQKIEMETIEEEPSEPEIKENKQITTNNTPSVTEKNSLVITDDLITEALKEDLKSLELEKDKLELNKPLLPLEIRDPLRVISSKADLSEFPELSQYNKLFFEVTENNPLFSPKLLKEDWQEHVLSRSKKEGLYLLDMVKGGQHLYLEVAPALEAPEFISAQQQFETTNAQHIEKLNYINSQIDSVKIRLQED